MTPSPLAKKLNNFKARLNSMNQWSALALGLDLRVSLLFDKRHFFSPLSKEFASTRKRNRLVSHYVTAAILVSQNNETAAILVSQTNPLGVELFFLSKRFLLFQEICIDAGHVSENILQ